MFIARPEALEPLLRVEYAYEDFPEEGDYADGALSHVLERMVAYAAGERGYHVRTVANADYAAISHTFLEYRMYQIGEAMPGLAIEQVHRVQPRLLSPADPVGYLKAFITWRYPRLAHRLVRVYRPARAAFRRLRPKRGAA